MMAGSAGALGIEAPHRRRSEEHTSELQSRPHLVCRLLLEKKNGSEKARAPKTRVQEVAGRAPGVRGFVVDSEEREQYERSLRELSMVFFFKDRAAPGIRPLSLHLELPV